MPAGYESTDLGPESVLYDMQPDELIADVRKRLDRALGFISNWYRAVDGADNEAEWVRKIDAVRAKVEAAEKAMDPALIFPGKTAQARFAEAQLAFPDLWRELSLSADMLPRPDLLDVAGGVFSSLPDAAKAAADTLSKLLADTLKAALANLWWVVGIGLGVVVVVIWLRTRRAG